MNLNQTQEVENTPSHQEEEYSYSYLSFNKLIKYFEDNFSKKIKDIGYKYSVVCKHPYHFTDEEKKLFIDIRDCYEFVTGYDMKKEFLDYSYHRMAFGYIDILMGMISRNLIWSEEISKFSIEFNKFNELENVLMFRIEKDYFCYKLSNSNDFSKFKELIENDKLFDYDGEDNITITDIQIMKK